MSLPKSKVFDLQKCSAERLGVHSGLMVGGLRRRVCCRSIAEIKPWTKTFVKVILMSPWTDQKVCRVQGHAQNKKGAFCRP